MVECAKRERNKNIIKECNAGATFTYLSNKYGISIERVRKIYIKAQLEDKIANEDPLFDALSRNVEAYNICQRWMGVKTLNDLKAYFANHTKEEILKVRGLGIAKLMLMEKAITKGEINEY